jgi:uncharacterized lipoprotein YddW (UPF0748 family)
MNIAYGLTDKIPDFAGLSPEEIGRRLRQMGCDGVFLKVLTREWVAGLQGTGLQVYASQGIFIDNDDLWQRFPGSRPIKADGDLAPVEEWYRPLRPTDRRVWDLRLQALDQLAQELPLDGVWLDFIRWPARWEKPELHLYDSSFDQETLAQFQEETGLSLPTVEPADAAAWILEWTLEAWIDWRCKVIERFVAEAAVLVHAHRPQARIGIFTIPWTGSVETDNTGIVDANHRIVGQDLKRLSRHADVISPMVYHRLCGHSPEWVGAVTQWSVAQSGVTVWPVIEAIDPPEQYPADEYAQALTAATEAGSGSVIIFKLEGLLMDPAKQR